MIELAGAQAVVGVTNRSVRPTVIVLRRYDAVLRALMDAYASVLPARFGTCAATVDELSQSMRDRRIAISRNLRLVRNRVQMTVRLFASDAGQSRVASASDPVRSGVRPRSGSRHGASGGTQYLQQRAAELHVPGASPIRTAVERWVRAERSERHLQGRLVGSLYHLIPRGAVSPYRRAVERATLDAGLITIVSGPWPPFAFTE
jgi:hypothetical protein